MHISVDRKYNGGGKFAPEDQKQACSIRDLRGIVQMQKHWDVKKTSAEPGHPSDDSPKLEREILLQNPVICPIVPITKFAASDFFAADLILYDF
jgi:hypothetical protein